MTLKELKKIIAEEYRYWMAEQPGNGEMGDMPMPDPAMGGGPDLPGVEMDPEMDIDPDGAGPEDAAATLKDIFDMLKDFFEGGDEAAPKPPKPAVKKDNGGGDDKGGDDKDKDDDKDDEKPKKKETNEAKQRKLKRALRLLESKGVFRKNKNKRAKTKRPNKFNKSPLVERFKKLANIIK